MIVKLNLGLDPSKQGGLALSAAVIDDAGAQMGTDEACTEPRTGFYSADFDLLTANAGGPVPDGFYYVEFTDDLDGTLLGFGELHVVDGLERTIRDLEIPTPEIVS